MKPQDFQLYLAGLGELTGEQMRLLGAALAGSRADAVALALLGDRSVFSRLAAEMIGPATAPIGAPMIQITVASIDPPV